MKSRSKFPKRRSGLPMSSIAMAAPPMLPLLFLALWASLALMGSRAHAQDSNADPLHPHDNVERSNANGIETNGAAEIINVNEHGTNVPRSAASAQQREDLTCDVTFRDLSTPDGWYSCPSYCTAWTGLAYLQQDQVVGTFTYTAGSPVCLAALHAGKIRHGEDTWVTVSMLPTNTSFVATIRNRVTSTSQDVGPGDNVFGYTIASSSPKAAEETDMSLAELIMIHNNNHQQLLYRPTPLKLACLPNARGGSLNDSRFFRWNYEAFELYHKDVKILEQNPSSVQITDKPIHNSRVLRCLGLAPALDVTGLFGRIDDVSATRPTVTASVGGTANISYASNDQSLERLPKIEWASHPSLISDVQLQHAGLYKVSSSYSRLIVRACPAHRYGTNCDSWCPDCLNGGECDSTTGRCVCAPGTRGHQCEDYCPEDQYGAQCHLNCSHSTLRWSAEGPTSCSGLTFCIRDPKGCSCLPGYKPPMCNDRCDWRYYGPDCALQCNYCNEGDCDRVTGHCNRGCKDPELCSAAHLPLNLPRLRTPPSVTGCSNKRCSVSLETWDNNSHDGELLERNVVTGYELELHDEQNETDWVTAGPVQAGQYGKEIVYVFIPGRRYSFRVRVLTSVGTADPEYNLRLREIAVSFPCLESYVGFVVTVMEITQTSFLIAGMNDKSCLPVLQYHLVVREWSTSRIMSNITSSATAQIATGLSQNTTYAVIFDGAVSSVNTLTQPPYPPNTIAIDSININTAWAKWPRPDRAERYITTLQIVRNESCTVPNRGPTLFFNTTNKELYLSNLIPYQRYDFCVMAANKGGQSARRCEEFVTSARDAPTITLSGLTCTPYQERMTCSVTVPDECERLNGPEPNIVWELRGGPACDSSLAQHAVFNETYRPGAMQETFYDLHSMVNYTVEVYVRNQIGRRQPGLQEVVQTPPANAPGLVQQLEVKSTSTSVVLRWSPPCPPLALVTSYEVSVSRIGNGAYKDVSLPHCSGQQDYFCHTESGLTSNREYQIKVRSCAPGRECSRAERRTIYTVESAPGAPIVKMTGRKTNAVSVNFTSPPHLGNGASCYLAAIVGEKILQNFTEHEELAENAVMPYTVAGLAASSLLRVTSRCCNEAGCSDMVQLLTSTLLAPLEAASPLRAEDITDTNVKLLLLPAIRAGDANISLVVLVQNITGKADSEPANFTVHYTSWKEDQRSPGSKRRSATVQHCSDPSPSVYVAGTAEQDQQIFVLGTGDGNNCKLTAGNRYRVAVVAVGILLDQVSVSEFLLDEPLVPGAGDGWSGAALGSLIVALLLLLLLLSVGGTWLFLRRRLRNRVKKGLACRGPIITETPCYPAPKAADDVTVNAACGQASYFRAVDDLVYQDVVSNEKPSYENVVEDRTYENDSAVANVGTSHTNTGLRTAYPTATVAPENIYEPVDPTPSEENKAPGPFAPVNDHIYDELDLYRGESPEHIYDPVVLPGSDPATHQYLEIL